MISLCLQSTHLPPPETVWPNSQFAILVPVEERGRERGREGFLESIVVNIDSISIQSKNVSF